MLIAVNASYMLISPRAWFHLPSWLRAQGSTSEDKFAAGWGAIQVRATGAIILGMMGWVLFDLLVRG
jgi:hypothetical protein